VALPTWTSNGYDDAGLAGQLGEVAGIGARWVELGATWYQQDAGADVIERSQQTASDQGLERAVALARAAGLKVLLKPAVEVTGASGSQGTIDPSDRTAWFASYTRMIDHYADLAARLHVEELSLGTELSQLTADAAPWASLIRDVRGRYKGLLTYAANFTEYRQVRFWDQLDVIGIDGFWPLTSSPTSEVPTLRRAWEPVRRDLAAFAAEQDRQVLFTEAGYTSVRGTTTKPWAWDETQAVDQQEQAAANEALLQTFEGERWWTGVYWWVWSALPDTGADTSRDFSIRGKAAEGVLRRHWTTS
jgi:N-acetylglutamate synthase-like GNAT family acetyltransferase